MEDSGNNARNVARNTKSQNMPQNKTAKNSLENHHLDTDKKKDNLGNNHGIKPKQIDNVMSQQQNEQDYLLQLAMDKQIHNTSITHPNFDDTQLPLDPSRPLEEIPSPPHRYRQELDNLFAEVSLKEETISSDGNKTIAKEADIDKTDSKKAGKINTQRNDYRHADAIDNESSMWSLIATPDLASHLELLQLGGLIDLPATFFEPVKAPKSKAGHQKPQTTQDVKTTSKTTDDSQNKQDDDKIGQDKQSEIAKTEASKGNSENNSDDKTKDRSELLLPLTDMQLLDLSDIYQVCAEHPNLTRYGFQVAGESHSVRACSTNLPEMINDVFAPNWELILYPERFDNGIDSLATDVLACSVAVHILKQSPTRKTVNRSITAEQICQHMRSYILNQCKVTPQFEQQYRQIRLFVGHVIVAAGYLGFKITHTNKHTTVCQTNGAGLPSQNLGQPVYINISSRASLLTRYPNISSYYINGWS